VLPCVRSAAWRPLKAHAPGSGWAPLLTLDDAVHWQAPMVPRMRGTGGRGKPGRMGMPAGGQPDAGAVRGFHKRKSARKVDGRYGARPPSPALCSGRGEALAASRGRRGGLEGRYAGCACRLLPPSTLGTQEAKLLG
jgi:hypothetical protein